jgi:cyclic dehypoxanthinyl futalosine synthase
MAQVALFFGANDLGGTMLEENVVAAAGCTFRMNREEMVDLIKGAGFTAAQRTTLYRIVRQF